MTEDQFAILKRLADVLEWGGAENGIAADNAAIYASTIRAALASSDAQADSGKSEVVAMCDRERFERWITTEGGYDPVDMVTQPGGEVYVLSAVHEAWEAWQGCLAAPQAECARMEFMPVGGNDHMYVNGTPEAIDALRERLTHDYQLLAECAPLDQQEAVSDEPVEHIASIYADADGTKHVQLDVEGIDDIPVGTKLYLAAPTLTRKEIEEIAGYVEDECKACSGMTTLYIAAEAAVEEALRRLAAPTAPPAECAPREASTWQPIETAPRDGTRFIAWHNGHADFFHWQSDNGSDRPVGWRDSFIYVSPEGSGPMHWMPLPAPPELAIEQAAKEKA